MSAHALPQAPTEFADARARVGPGPSRAAVRAGVAVVNWNGHRDTIECLQSLLEADPLPARVVVVDNGSGDGSLQHIAYWADRQQVPYRVVYSPDEGPEAGQAQPWLTLLASRSNRGFSGGNNLALAWLAPDASLSHFLLLNNDATVAPDFFADVADALRASPAAGLLSGSIYTAADHSRVWYAGGVAKPYRALMLHAYTVPDSAEPAPTEFICGCSMLISRAAFDALGPLPECYDPAYCEDAEYSVRARARGFSLVYAPRPTVYHKVGATFGGSQWVVPLVAYVQNRNRVLFVRRNLRGLQRWVALGYLAVTKPGRAVVEALRGRPAIASAIARGTAAGFVSPAARQRR